MSAVVVTIPKGAKLDFTETDKPMKHCYPKLETAYKIDNPTEDEDTEDNYIGYKKCQQCLDKVPVTVKHEGE